MLTPTLMPLPERTLRCRVDVGEGGLRRHSQLSRMAAELFTEDEEDFWAM